MLRFFSTALAAASLFFAFDVHADPPASPPRLSEDFWVQGEGGMAFTALDALGGDFPVAPPSQGGTLLGAALGARILDHLTIGARYRVTSAAWTLHQALLDVAWHVPNGAVDPYVGVRGGWLWSDTHLEANVEPVPGAPAFGSVGSPHGASVGPAIGVDLYAVPELSFGAEVSCDVLFLHDDVASTRGLLPALTFHVGLHHLM